MGWGFDAGNLALDFANTAEWHASEQPTEFLKSFEDLLSWAVEAGILKAAAAGQLSSQAKHSRRKAARALTRAVKMRELTYRIFSAIAADQSPASNDLTAFNQTLSRAMSHANVRRDRDRFVWDWETPELEFDRILWPVARAAADLLTSDLLDRVGECADDRGCGYLFIDTSKNHSRRWCSMESCGNRAKARRFYEQKKKS